jgi:o-succinylbenzoate---CoA ligase
MFNLSFSSDYPEIQTIQDFLLQLENREEIVLQTSGSTGIPKKIIYASSQLLNSAAKTNAFFQLTESTRALLCMSPKVIAGKMMLARAYLGDYNLQIIPPTKRPLATITESIDFVAMVPLQLSESLQHDIQKLKSIQTILIGGGPIPANLEETLRKNKLTVYHSFGMTETVSHIALRKVGFETQDDFQALPGITFSVKEDQLVIHAPDLNIDHLETNDLVELSSPTSFKWLGRKDFVVNSGGYKLLPELLENRLSKFLQVPFFLWREEDAKWGEKLVLYIESAAWPALSEMALLEEFQKHELPKVYYLCPVFVTTESGKVNRIETAKMESKETHETAF